MAELVFTPNSVHQERALASTKRFVACVGGKRGGKTTVGAAWLIQEIGRQHFEEGRNGNYLIVVPTFRIWEQATSIKFRELFGQLKWGEWKQQRSCFELKWKDAGGEPYKIFVRSADEPDHIEGITALAAWLDEAGMMKDGTWDNVQARLSIDRGRCIMTTTPYAPNWFWREVIARAGTVNGEEQHGADIEPQLELIRWSSVDNPAFSREEYDRLKRTMSPEQFARDYNGEAVRMEGLVYPALMEADCLVKPFQIPPEWRRFAGVDFGHTDPTVVVFIAQKPEVQADPEHGIDHKASEFFVYKEFYKAGALLNEVAQALEGEPLDFILGDPTAAQQIAELTRFYKIRHLLPADNTRDVGIERLKGLTHEGRLFFFRGRAMRTWEDMRAYHYREPNPDRPVKDDPVGVADHGCDALRYAFSREYLPGLYRGMKKPAAARRPKTVFYREWENAPSSDYGVDRYTAYQL